MGRFWSYAIIISFCVSLTVTGGVRPSRLSSLDAAAAATVVGFPSSLPPQPQPPAIATLAEARGKKKKLKKTSAILMIGGSLVAASVVLFGILNAITATLVKAFVFTFIAKFLVSANWRTSGSTSTKNTHRKDNIMIVME